MINQHDAALRAHNKKITNPRMVYHTPLFYKMQKLWKALFVATWNLSIIALIGAGVYFAVTYVISLF